jgi:hypothetical protein
MSVCMTALKRAAPPTSATFSAPNREMKAEAGAEAVNSAVRDAGPVSVTRTRALADLERALPLIAIPILGAASIGFVLHTQLSCKCSTSMWRRTFIITLNLKKGA